MVHDLLFLQHGWADTNQTMWALGQKLRSDHTLICAPDLGWWRTWGKFTELYQRVRAQALELLEAYPHAPVKIVGHSLGGLIWLEILADHPQWWSRMHSLVLLAVPVGGADLARTFDPWGSLPLIARDLAKSRRSIATSIARHIPTLVIAGDWDGGSDGTIVVGTTRFLGANWHCIQGAHHAQVRWHPQTVALIKTFWQNPTIAEPKPNWQTHMLEYLYSLSLTDAHARDLRWAQRVCHLKDNHTLWQWTSPLWIKHIFITDPYMAVVYGAFAGWLDRGKLDQVIAHLKANYSP